ncbi:MAG: stage II sporulation protein M [Bacillota bacterium]
MCTLFFPVKQVIKVNRSWIIMASSIFFIAALVFYFSNLTSTAAFDEETAGGQLEPLNDLFSMILETPPVISAMLVFMNNFFSMALMLLLGFLAGILPLITLGLNGSLVGTILAHNTQDGIPLLPSIVFGLLPHGIFELFAFFLCGAIGLKFGYHCIAAPLPDKTRMQSFRHIWKEAISILPLVLFLLITAAFIEVMITPHLLETTL